jgi:hypothetical protein
MRVRPQRLILTDTATPRRRTLAMGSYISGLAKAGLFILNCTLGASANLGSVLQTLVVPCRLAIPAIHLSFLGSSSGGPIPKELGSNYQPDEER